MLVTLHVWAVPAGRVPDLCARTALWRTRQRGFTKFLGTTRPLRFGLADADLRRWALLAAWPDPSTVDASARLVAAWERAATESWRADLVPLWVTGAWARRQPFGDPVTPTTDRGPVAVLTRARLRPRAISPFWRAIPDVGADLAERPGLRCAFGIGEAPGVWQGTFSLWDDVSALRAFAYDRPAHADVIDRARTRGWYAEELFARLGVVSSSGTLHGISS